MRKFIDGSARGKKAVASILARAWRDAGYRSRLIASPRAIFAAAGIAVPEDIPITVTCDSDVHLNVLLGADPSPGSARPLPDAPDFRAVCAYIDARCREDPAFEGEFLAEPADMIRSLGCALPPGTAVSVHLARPDHAFFNLPRPPRGDVQPDRPDDVDDRDIAIALHASLGADRPAC